VAIIFVICRSWISVILVIFFLSIMVGEFFVCVFMCLVTCFIYYEVKSYFQAKAYFECYLCSRNYCMFSIDIFFYRFNCMVGFQFLKLAIDKKKK